MAYHRQPPSPSQASDPGALWPTGASGILVRLTDELLDVQAETGDPHSQQVLDRAVEHLADRLVELADLGMAGTAGDQPATPVRPSPPGRSGPAAPVGGLPSASPPPSLERRALAGDPAGCSAAAAALRRVAAALPGPAPHVGSEATGTSVAAPTAAALAAGLRSAGEDLLRLAEALQQHAERLAEIRLLWRRTGDAMDAEALWLVDATVHGPADRVGRAQSRIDRVLSLRGRAQADLSRAAHRAAGSSVSA